MPGMELLLVNSAVRNLIRENKVHELGLVIETSADQGMISMNRYLANMVKKGEISMEVAENYSLNPTELKMLTSK